MTRCASWSSATTISRSTNRPCRPGPANERRRRTARRPPHARALGSQVPGGRYALGRRPALAAAARPAIPLRPARRSPARHRLRPRRQGRPNGLHGLPRFGRRHLPGRNRRRHAPDRRCGRRARATPRGLPQRIARHAIRPGLRPQRLGHLRRSRSCQVRPPCGALARARRSLDQPHRLRRQPGSRNRRTRPARLPPPLAASHRRLLRALLRNPRSPPRTLRRNPGHRLHGLGNRPARPTSDKISLRYVASAPSEAIAAGYISGLGSMSWFMAQAG